MAQASWAEQVTTRFFDGRKSPTRLQCNELAQSISGASTVDPVDSPGSMSYTVVCTGPQQDLVISFREPGAVLDEETVRLAKKIHGDLVPEAVYHGNMEGANPPLFIYSMPYIRGSSYIEAIDCQVEMSPDEETKHRHHSETVLLTTPSYFARCWSNPQPVNPQTQAEQQEGIHSRLDRLIEESPLPIQLNQMLSELVASLPSLFSQDYPQVLTHNDFSVTNIVVDEDTFEITGIVDWSLAAIMPFGMDSDILFLGTGFMARDGWHDYTCRPLLQATFWEEFWAASGIEGEEHRGRVRSLAETARKIGAVLRLAFQRNADGSPSNEVLVSESSMQQLSAWFGDEAAKPT